MSTHHPKPRFPYLIAASATAFSISVATPPPAQALPWLPLLFQGIQYIQLSNTSDKQKIQVGKQINQQLQRRGMRFEKDRSINAYVNRIGQRLAAANGGTKIPYKFQVVEDKSINAFATTGGYVYVNTGLLKAADNEAQVASVIGHEMGHIQSNHLIEQMQQTALSRGLLTAAGVNQNILANIGIELALNKPHSRQDEFEADQRGLQTLRKAGYAESAMPEFMKKLLKQGSPPTFLSDHPAVPDRISALEKAIQSSPGNSCEQNSQAASCGLNKLAYEQSVQDRL